jgi:Mor family transcriptional regulator
MKRATKRARVISFIQSNPGVAVKDVAKKFRMAVPTIYNIRKQALPVAVDTSDVLTQEQANKVYQSIAKNASTSKANDVQYGGDHYMALGVQPWDAMEAWMSPEAFAGFLRGNAIKYLARTEKKGGVEDLKKARHYLDKLIELVEAHQ